MLRLFTHGVPRIRFCRLLLVIFKTKLKPVVVFLLITCSAPLQAHDSAPVKLDPVTVIEDEPLPPVGIDYTQVSTTYRIEGDAVNLLSYKGGSNPYTVIDRLPSVNYHSLDPYGLANIPGGNKGLRIRGELSTHGSTGTVDGLPLTGINPGPGYQWLFDLDNIGAVSLQQGPISPDRFNFFTTGGALNSEILWPKAESALVARQAFGAFNFKRSFLRIDTGELPDSSKLFLSASYTDVDKWRGPGKSPSDRFNIEAAWSRQLGEHGNGKLLFAYNDADAHNYRPLTYAQASNLGTWQYFDYSDNPQDGINYFENNRQSFENWTLIGEFDYDFGKAGHLTVKPYYLSENGEYLNGMSNGKVRRWLIDHDWYGVTAEWQTQIAATDIKLGFWWESSEPPGPPTAWKFYTPTDRGTLTNAKWSILADTTTRHQFYNVYALFEHGFGALTAQAGVRYVHETLPGFDFYNGTGLGDLSLDEALAQSSGVIKARSVSSFGFDEFLPFIAFDYAFSRHTNLKLSFGRNYGAPAFDVWPVYQQKSAIFLAQGITADQLWHSIKPETSEALDIGINLHAGTAYFAPTVYYARHHHKKVSYDSGLGVTYSHNNGESQAYGVQLAAGWSPRSDLDLFATASYNRNVFVKDLPMDDGSTQSVKDKQLPDTPIWLASAGATWRYKGLDISPLMHYSGSRYADTRHSQKIEDYVTFDLNLAYHLNVADTALKMSLSVQNLFNERHIGFVNASYYQLLSDTNAYFYPGAPRTISGAVSLEF